MPEPNKPSPSARLALFYITAGALLVVWTALAYWFYLVPRVPDGTDSRYFWCYGFFFTGLVLMIIGFAVGRIGRAARHAELPPPDGAARQPAPVPPAAAPQPMYPAAVVPPAPPGAIPVAAAPATPAAPRR
jgi:hypothetical protein